MEWKLIDKKIEDDHVIYNICHEDEKLEIRRKILEDNDGFKYYEVLNFKSIDLNFAEFPKTMYEMIVSGKVDFMLAYTVPKLSIRLYKYIDENKGEIIREQTLKNFKDIKFGYTIIAKFDDTTSLVSKDFTINNYIRNADIVKFETKNEADKKAKYLNDEYNYEISKNKNYIMDNDTYKELSSKLTGMEKFLALNSIYGCNPTVKNHKYEQIYFVRECAL